MRQIVWCQFLNCLLCCMNQSTSWINSLPLSPPLVTAQFSTCCMNQSASWINSLPLSPPLVTAQFSTCCMNQSASWINLCHSPLPWSLHNSAPVVWINQLHGSILCHSPSPWSLHNSAPVVWINQLHGSILCHSPLPWSLYNSAPVRGCSLSRVLSIPFACVGSGDPVRVLRLLHNEYTGYTLKHLFLRHMYKLPLPMLTCYVLKPYALRLPTGGFSPGQVLTLATPLSQCVCWNASHTVLCGDLYTACVDASRTVFWDR